MLETTGETPDPTLLAEVLVPTLDIGTLTELETYQVEKINPSTCDKFKRPIDVSDYAELREYIWKKQQRERTIMPIPAMAMDLSLVGAYGG